MQVRSGSGTTRKRDGGVAWHRLRLSRVGRGRLPRRGRRRKGDRRRSGKNSGVSGGHTIACSGTGGTRTTHGCGGAKADAAGTEGGNGGGTCRSRIVLIDGTLVVVGAVGRQASSVGHVGSGWRGAGQADLGSGEGESSLVGGIGNGARVDGRAGSNRVASLEDVDKRHGDRTTAVALHVRGGRRGWLVGRVVGVGVVGRVVV